MQLLKDMLALQHHLIKELERKMVVLCEHQGVDLPAAEPSRKSMVPTGDSEKLGEGVVDM